MGGFLEGLGEIAGGVSKGISKETEDRARRSQARAAEDALAEAQAERGRQDTLAQNIANAGRVDANGNPIALIPNAAAPPPRTFKGDMTQIGGALAGLFSRKNVDQTAVAAGVREPPPPATLGVQPATVQDRLAAVAAPAAAPRPGSLAASVAPSSETAGVLAAGLPPTSASGVPVRPDASVVAAAAGGAPAAPASVANLPTPPPAIAAQVPDRVPVIGGEGATREPNEIDRHLYLAKAYGQAHMFKEAEAEHQAYSQLAANRYIQNIPTMTGTELNRLGSKVMGEGTDVTRNQDGTYTVTRMDNGKPTVVMDKVQESRFQAAVGGYLDQDPTAMAKLANSTDERLAAHAEAVAKINAQNSVAEEARATAARTTQTTGREKVVADKSDQYDRDRVKMSDPWASVLYGNDYDTWANSEGIRDKDGHFFSSMTDMDPTTGAAMKKEIATRIEAGKTARAAFKALSPVTQYGLVGAVADPKTGDRHWAVIGPHGGPMPNSNFGTDLDAAVKAASAALADGRTYGTTDPAVVQRTMDRWRAGKATAGMVPPGAPPAAAPAAAPAAKPAAKPAAAGLPKPAAKPAPPPVPVQGRAPGTGAGGFPTSAPPKVGERLGLVDALIQQARSPGRSSGGLAPEAPTRGTAFPSRKQEARR